VNAFKQLALNAAGEGRKSTNKNITRVTPHQLFARADDISTVKEDPPRAKKQLAQPRKNPLRQTHC
jgi:hypothetical protein